MNTLDHWAARKGKENRARMKAAKEKAQLLRLAERQFQIWQKAILAIANSFPDGDPIDHLTPYMERNDITMQEVDAAVNRYEKTRGGFYGWLAAMWDDTAADHIYDAKNGYIEPNSVFYSVADNGSIEPSDNPWRPQ